MAMRRGTARLLLDTNIWMYYFLGEEPFRDEIVQLIALGQTDQLDLCPTTAKDLFYLIPRALRRMMIAEKGRPAEHDDLALREAAWGCLESMFDLAVLAPQGAAECDFARMLRGEVRDFEDGMIFAAAETAEADYVVTLDGELLSKIPEVFVTPARALELLGLFRPGRACGQGAVSPPPARGFSKDGDTPRAGGIG